MPIDLNLVEQHKIENFINVSERYSLGKTQY